MGATGLEPPTFSMGNRHAHHHPTAAVARSSFVLKGLYHLATSLYIQCRSPCPQLYWKRFISMIYCVPTFLHVAMMCLGVMEDRLTNWRTNSRPMPLEVPVMRTQPVSILRFFDLESFFCFQVKVVYIGQMSDLLSRSGGIILADSRNPAYSGEFSKRITRFRETVPHTFR